MTSKAATVEAYLAELSEERRNTLQAVREVILANLHPDYAEGMTYGMIGYFVPHEIYPSGYHCDPKQPLPFAALASQKNYMSIYLPGVSGESDLARWFAEAWAESGKKLDKGVSCLRFKKLDDIDLNVIGEVIRRQPVDVFVGYYESQIKPPARKK